MVHLASARPPWLISLLRKLGVILRYHITINWEKLGYKWFKVDLYLKDYNKIYKILNYVETNPHLTYLVKTLGYADLELEFVVESAYQLKQIIEDISSKFPKMIRNYTYFSIEQPHKWIDLPEDK